MQNCLVAVIIPTLNEERFIESCLKSVINQTFKFENMDIMVVDGGSTDNTISIVEKFHNQYPNIRLIHNPGKIQSIAFNIGVKESDAPYIIRLDAHAKYDVRYIELCIKHLHNDSTLGNVGGICKIKSRKGNKISEANAILNKVKFGIGGASFRVGKKAKYVDTVPFGAFPRSVLEKIGGMREDLARGEDNEINSRIRKNGYKIYLDPKIVSTYYSRDTVLGSMKQMYKNGLSIGKLLYIDKHSVGLRHMIPLFFVLSIIFSLLLTFVTPYALILLFIILASYFTASITAALHACAKYGKKYIYILPWLFFLIHISYGWGTIVGIIKK